LRRRFFYFNFKKEGIKIISLRDMRKDEVSAKVDNFYVNNKFNDLFVGVMEDNYEIKCI
jgi:hypothetical protein